MRKLILALLAALALLAPAAVVASPASAVATVTNGNHDQEFTCTTYDTAGGAGTTFTSVFSYKVTGYGNSDPNTVWPQKWAFHTTPSALLDYATIRLVDSASDSGIGFKTYGSADGIPQNTVSSSFSTTNFNGGLGWENGSPVPDIRLEIIGGVSNGWGQCTRTRALL